MKTWFTFMVCACYAATTWAQTSNITFFSEQGFPFYVMINGATQNAAAQPNVKVTGLRAEMSYKAKVVFLDNTMPNVDKMFYLEPDVEVTVNVKQNKKGEYVMQWMGSVPIEQASTGSGQYVADYNVNGVNTTTNHTTTAINPSTTTTTTVTTQETTTTTTSNPTTTTTNSGGWNTTVTTHDGINTGTPTTTTNNGTSSETVNMNVDFMGVGMNVDVHVTENGLNTNTNTNGTNWDNTNTNTNWNNTNTNTTTTTTTTTTTYTTTTDNTNWNTTNTANNTNYNTSSVATGNGCYPIGDAEYNTIKQSIESKSFDDAQLTQAKQITPAKCLSATHIAGIMKDVLQYESTRLEYAKYAYPYCSDPQNYYLVNDAFSHSSSIEELEEALHP